MGKKVIIKRNPDFEWCMVELGQLIVPTKQEKYKPLIGYEGIMKDTDNIDVILKELYVRNPDKEIVKRFEEKFRQSISKDLEKKFPIKKPETVEIILNIYVEKKRYFDVDVDNLAKTILDCFSGILIEDDSQVISLLVQKRIGQFNMSGISIGLRKIDDFNKSLFEDIKLYYYEEFED
ncbi:MAG: RusA family crossover junction endodeoxyribonuclease [Bacteroidetes bacterium]|nr:RusA family crossover junction endodeoxyribonuclease [Bacteroidota bacterium]HET6246050.1 RusA family crossover junction endodeoxyribonuclease [Bacteroidia bacterium]